MTALLLVLSVAVAVLMTAVAYLWLLVTDLDADHDETRRLLALHVAGCIVGAHLKDMADLRNATTVEDVLRGEDR